MFPTHLRLAPLLTLCVAALLAALALSAPAHANFQWSEPLRNQKDEGFCIGIGQRPDPYGTLTGLYRCDGRINQDYQFLDTRFETRIKVNNGTGYCLRISDVPAADGSRDVYQGNCFGADVPRARWRLTDSPGGIVNQYAAYASIQSRKYPSLCIGVAGGAMFHGNTVRAYPCDFHDYGNQNWYVNPGGSPMP
jgi:hypothetical protein